MRVGLITQLLWARYGAFWEILFRHAGLEILRARPERLERALGDERLEDVPGMAFRLAVAEALALQEADVLLAPELNPDQEVPRGGGQDPWIASFPEALASGIGGLPPILGVPASLELSLESLVITILQSLTRDPALARRAWEKSRGYAKPSRYPEPHWNLPETVGIVGQPWLVNDGVMAKLDGRHLVSQHHINPAVLRREGRRVDVRLVDTDSEVLGAVHLLSRKGSVKELVMLLDQTSGGDSWLYRQAQRSLHKPLEAVYLQDLFEKTAEGGNPMQAAAALLAP